MAIIAKCDVFIVNPTTDVQPAVGEVWLITSLATGGMNSSVDLQYVALYDGTDTAALFDATSGGTAPVGVGFSFAGATSSSAMIGNSSLKVVITNTVRLRFGSNGFTWGYTGVQLA